MYRKEYTRPVLPYYLSALKMNFATAIEVVLYVVNNVVAWFNSYLLSLNCVYFFLS